jgi:hypothetical protein
LRRKAGKRNCLQGVGAVGRKFLLFLIGELDGARGNTIPDQNVNSPAQNLVQLNSTNGQPRLRDRLLLLIREHQLDSSEVRRYAAEFCQVTSLREAKREQIESLLEHLTAVAAQGHEQLLETIGSSRKKAA